MVVTDRREADWLLLLAEASSRLPENGRGAPATKLLPSRWTIWLLRCCWPAAAAGRTPIAAHTMFAC